jgi:regulator of protease activity HflC (stomatin/prohibitin superfamily)
MDSALGWIGELAKWFAAWIPKLIIVDKRNKAIKFVRGSKAKEVGPGLIFYWPIITICEIYPVVQQALTLKTQTLRTKDKVVLEVECLVTYAIVDLLTLVTEVHDPDQWIADICLGAARQVVCTSTLEELENDHTATDRSLANEIRKLVKPLGVRVVRARFISQTPIKAIKLFGSAFTQEES